MFYFDDEDLTEDDATEAPANAEESDDDEE